MMEGYTWCRVRCVTGVLASTGDGNEQGFVRRKTNWATSSSRLATLLAREHAGENRRGRIIGQNVMIAASMYSPRLVRCEHSGSSWSTTDASVCKQLDFLELDTRDGQEDDHDQQSRSKKEKEKYRVGVGAKALKLSSPE